MKITALLFATLLTLAHSQAWYNTGRDTLYISTETQLRELSTLVSTGTDGASNFAGKTIMLTNDIVLASNFAPIGNGSSRPFSGTFDGQGYTISGLSVSGVDYAGLFGYVGGNGQIKNVNVIAAKIKTNTTGTTYAGGLVADYNSSKPIENCSARADSVIAAGSGSSHSGGLVGYAHSISNSYATGNVSSTGYSGGLAGYAYSSTISNSYATGNVSSTGSYSGGLVGYAYSSTTISNSYATGRVSSTGSYSGGLVGYAISSLAISNSYATGNVSSTGSSGGLVGSGSPTISNSYATGEVSASGSSTYSSTYSGGLVGDGSPTISNSYATGSVSANNTNNTSSSYNSYSGGLVGNGSPTISNSYASGNVSATKAGTGTGSAHSGGLVGYSGGTIKISYSYASGNISASKSGTGTGSAYSGGILGFYNSNNFLYTSVYYNSNGAATAVGSGLSTGISSLSSENLKKQANFNGWDFNETWNIVENSTYPFFVNIPDQIYTGSQIKPEPTICLNGTTLIKETHYNLSYGANRNAGIGTVTITGIGSYSYLSKTIKFTIAQKTLTLALAGVVAQNKIYDGTTTAIITRGSLIGVVGGDDVSFEATGEFSNKNAGNSKTVSASITLKGTQANNYKIQSPISLKADITPKPLTITLNPKTIEISTESYSSLFHNYVVYDGLIEGDAILIYTYIHIIGNEQPLAVVIGNQSSGIYYTISAIGTYPITLSLAVTTANYEISYDNTDLYLVATEGTDNGNPSSSSGGGSQIYEYCVFIQDRFCLSGSYENCPTGGTLSNNCPFEETPIRLPQISISNIIAKAVGNSIVLENLPPNAKVGIYNLQGKRVYSTINPENPKILRIGVQTKGIYIVKTTFGSETKMLRVVVR